MYSESSAQNLHDGFKAAPLQCSKFISLRCYPRFSTSYAKHEALNKSYVFRNTLHCSYVRHESIWPKTVTEDIFILRWLLRQLAGLLVVHLHHLSV